MSSSLNIFQVSPDSPGLASRAKKQRDASPPKRSVRAKHEENWEVQAARHIFCQEDIALRAARDHERQRAFWHSMENEQLIVVEDLEMVDAQELVMTEM